MYRSVEYEGGGTSVYGGDDDASGGGARGGGGGGGGLRGEAGVSGVIVFDEVGLCKLNLVSTHSLKCLVSTLEPMK